MKVVILSTEQPNQIALCHKLSADCELLAVVFSRNQITPPKSTVTRLQTFVDRASVRVLGHPLLRAWEQLQRSYRTCYPAPPQVPSTVVRNINDPETTRVLREYSPDLIVVSGTNLIGRRTIDSAPPDSRWLNLHTGLSPYIRGGPNCTNWCLAERLFGLIGNTVMWLDDGIDSGDLIATERTPLDGSETLFELHWKVMEHAHDLCCRVVRRIAAGQAVTSVPQRTIDRGRTFYNRQWNGVAARRALAGFRRDYPAYFAANTASAIEAGLRLVPLDAPR